MDNFKIDFLPPTSWKNMDTPESFFKAYKMRHGRLV